MAAILNGGELTLSGDVGDYWGGDCFSYADVVLILAQVDDDAELTVRLNSGGGIAPEGAAIHALLARRSGRTHIIVDGMAVSAASLIAMAGDTVTMTMGAYMMIHDPSAFTVGTSADHAKSIEGLEALSTSYARVYAAKSGKSAEECRAIMKAETWFTAQQAVEAGFADESDEQKAMPVAAFDYRLYAHAPKRFSTLAAKKDWRRRGVEEGAAMSAANRPNQEPPMTDKERADQLAAENEQLKAQMKASNEANTSAELEALRAEKKARENTDAIMALDEAKGREAQAKALADAGIDVAVAKGILTAAPTASDGDTTGRDAYEAARANGAGLTSARQQNPSPSASMVANMRKLLGKETV